MNEFAERYKKTSTSDLLRIINNPSEYQPLALEAATAEIANRQLTPEQLREAQAELEADQLRIEQSQATQRAMEEKVTAWSATVTDAVNPYQTGPITTDRQIQAISIFFLVLALYYIYTLYDFAGFLLFDDAAEFDPSLVLYFLPLVITPLAAFFFWQRKKIGWILVTIYLTYVSASEVFLFVQALNMREYTGGILFPSIPLVQYIGAAIVYIWCLWIVCKANIREQYAINTEAMLKTLIFTTTAVVFLMIGMIW
jgi:hypothetical protein